MKINSSGLLWAVLWNVSGTLGEHLSSLGAVWGRLDVILSRLGAIVSRLGAILGALKATSDRSRADSKLSWAVSERLGSRWRHQDAQEGIRQPPIEAEPRALPPWTPPL